MRIYPKCNLIYRPNCINPYSSPPVAPGIGTNAPIIITYAHDISDTCGSNDTSPVASITKYGIKYKQHIPIKL